MKLRTVAAVAAISLTSVTAHAQNESGTFAVSNVFGLDTAMLDFTDWICGPVSVTIVQASGDPHNGPYVSIYFNSVDGNWHLLTQPGFSATGRCVKKSAFPGGTSFEQLDEEIATPNCCSGIGEHLTSKYPSANASNSLGFANILWGAQTRVAGSGQGVFRTRDPNTGLWFWQEAAEDEDMSSWDNVVQSMFVTYPGSTIPSSNPYTLVVGNTGAIDRGSQTSTLTDDTGFCFLSSSWGEFDHQGDYLRITDENNQQTLSTNLFGTGATLDGEATCIPYAQP